MERGGIYAQVQTCASELIDRRFGMSLLIVSFCLVRDRSIRKRRYALRCDRQNEAEKIDEMSLDTNNRSFLRPRIAEYIPPSIRR